jgi:ribosomal-protein-alanine acetyltransferase
MRPGVGGPDIVPMTEQDLPGVGAIQLESPLAAQWEPRDYLGHESWLALEPGTRNVAGFLVLRAVAAGEWEILNLAVRPQLRHQGIGTRLLDRGLTSKQGAVFLEVRASNGAARAFYRKAGFVESSRRPGYYTDPDEEAVVMRLQKC